MSSIAVSAMLSFVVYAGEQASGVGILSMNSGIRGRMPLLLIGETPMLRISALAGRLCRPGSRSIMPEPDYAQLDLLVLDVDGVLTDGRIVYSSAGDELKHFHVRDGSGMKYWKRLGKRLAIITGRQSELVLRRAEELQVDTVRQGCKDKLPALREVLTELGASPERTAIMGDDLTDLPVLRHCAVSACPADAVEEVRRRVNYVCNRAGGAGCVREFIEHLLRSANLWPKVMQRYLPAPGREDATA